MKRMVTAKQQNSRMCFVCGLKNPSGLHAHFYELESVKVSLENLLTFPWIRERVEAQRLTLHGWYFDLADGHLLRLDPATDEFARIEG